MTDNCRLNEPNFLSLAQTLYGIGDGLALTNLGHFVMQAIFFSSITYPAAAIAVPPLAHPPPLLAH